MSKTGALSVIAILGLVLLSCTGEKTGPVEVKWDRDGCKRCRMVLSDRFHSAQVRYQLPGERTRVFKFDDIGCAVLWLKDKRWRDEPTTEIWVNDHRTGEWIDARSATYVPGQMTPMAYGLGAQTDPVDYGLTFVEARRYIFDTESRQPSHGAHLRKQEQDHLAEADKTSEAGEEDDCE